MADNRLDLSSNPAALGPLTGRLRRAGRRKHTLGALFELAASQPARGRQNGRGKQSRRPELAARRSRATVGRRAAAAAAAAALLVGRAARSEELAQILAHCCARASRQQVLPANRQLGAPKRRHVQINQAGRAIVLAGPALQVSANSIRPTLRALLSLLLPPLLLPPPPSERAASWPAEPASAAGAGRATGATPAARLSYYAITSCCCHSPSR